jgi:cobalt-zinc-cadmium efflux system protein
MPHNHRAKANSANLSFKIALALNVAIVAMQAVFGFLSHSVALIADAGHNVTDVLSLILALGANMLAARPPTSKRTYGYRRTTILASLLNAVLLLITTGAIMYSAIDRFRDPVQVDGGVVTIVAAIGIVLNGFSAWLFSRGRNDLNVRAAFVHMAGDAAVSAGVVTAGLIILWTGALWVDPLMSVVISVVILLGTWRILRESFNLAADAVPEDIDSAAIESYLRSINGVREVHDLHIWGMSTTEVALTAHLVMPSPPADDSFLHSVVHELQDRFRINHTTIQIERGTGDFFCHQSPEDVV